MLYATPAPLGSSEREIEAREYWAAVGFGGAEQCVGGRFRPLRSRPGRGSGEGVSVSGWKREVHIVHTRTHTDTHTHAHITQRWSGLEREKQVCVRIRK